MATPISALCALALILALLAIHRSHFCSWLIILALALSLLPAVFMAMVLCERLAGYPAMLSVWSAISQRTGIILQAIACTVEFASATALGWLWYAGLEAKIPFPRTSCSRWLGVPAIIGVLCVWFFALVNFRLQSGKSIFYAAYHTSVTGNELIYSGAWPVLANLSLLMLEVPARRWPVAARMALNALWAVQFLVFLLQGDRVNVLAALFILLLMRIRSFRRQSAVLLLGAVVGVPFLTFVSVFRQLAASGTTSFSSIVSRTTLVLGHMNNVGDLGDLAVTSTAGIYMVESHRTPLLFGMSYLEYIPRLLPSALRGGHVVNAANYFNIFGMNTNGGMTPVSEAYFNFSWCGCLLVGLANGWLIAWLHRRSLRTPSPLWISFYVVAVAYAFRGYFYGAFDLIKVEFILLLYIGAINLISLMGRPAPAPIRTGAVGIR